MFSSSWSTRNTSSASWKSFVYTQTGISESVPVHCRLQMELTQSLFFAIVGSDLTGTTKSIVNHVCNDLLPNPCNVY